MTPIGSDSWLGATGYEEGHELHERATSFFATIIWDELISLASKMRGVDCELSEAYSIGHFNLVRRLLFADGISWIARLRMPYVAVSSGDHSPTQGFIRIEVDSMKFLRSKSSIPVPEVFAYDSDPNNAVGAQYILMSYIHGNPAEELRMARDCEPGLFGTSEQDERFRRGMASIHVQLANLRFDRIGSPLQDPKEPDRFTVGPEIETGKGPWDTPEAYYAALAGHKLRAAESEAEPEVREQESFSLPQRFPAMMRKYQQHHTGPFGLANRDFGAHNVLADEDFNIVGLIDFDSLIAAPIEFVAQAPQFMDLERPTPGHIETNKFAIERIEETKHLLPQYIGYVRDAIKEFEAATGRKDQSGLPDAIMSDGVSVVQGLVEYGMYAGFINDRWWAAYDMLSGAKGEGQSEQ